MVFANHFISDILHSIADNEDIYNLIAKCMVNFDFIAEWQKSALGNRIDLPIDESKRIAFIFCMLNNIDDKNLDINKILEHYFSYDEDVNPYELFKTIVIEEFVTLIMQELNISFDDENTNEEEEPISDELEEENENSSEEEKEEQIDIDAELEKMLEIVLQMKKMIRGVKHFWFRKVTKTELISIVSTLEYAIKTKELEYFYALVLSIKYLTKSIRNVRELANNLELISNKVIRS